jgi:hypothetical protein
MLSEQRQPSRFQQLSRSKVFPSGFVAVFLVRSQLLVKKKKSGCYSHSTMACSSSVEKSTTVFLFSFFWFVPACGYTSFVLIVLVTIVYGLGIVCSSGKLHDSRSWSFTFSAIDSPLGFPLPLSRRHPFELRQVTHTLGGMDISK